MKKQQAVKQTARSQAKSARKTTASRTRSSSRKVAAAKARVGAAAKKVVTAARNVVKAVKGAKARRAAPKATGAVARRKLTVRSTVVRGGNVVTTTLGQPLMPSVIALVKDRFERRSREYDDARKQFEAAAEAVRSADSDDKSIKLRTNLNHFGTEMRVQAARRAELDWLQRVLQGEGS